MEVGEEQVFTWNSLRDKNKVRENCKPSRGVKEGEGGRGRGETKEDEHVKLGTKAGAKRTAEGKVKVNPNNEKRHF